MSLSAEVIETPLLDSGAAPDAPATEIEARSPEHLRRIYFWFVAIGIASSALTNPGGTGIAGQPLKYLMKTQLHYQPTDMAKFFAVGALVFTFKPLVGILTDAVPLFRTRRRWYLIISAALAGLFWIGLGFAPRTPKGLLWSVTGINICLMAISTVVGGLLVEAGQRFHSTGQLTSLRSLVANLSYFIVGPIAGFLATRTLILTAGLGASLPLALAAMAFFLLREKPVAQRNRNAGRNLIAQARSLARSRSLWTAVGAYFLFYFAPGFQTPLYYYQTNTLNLSQQFIGNLGMITGIAGAGAALAYLFLCRRMTLRHVLFFCISMEILGGLSYRFYLGPTSAAVVAGFAGLTNTLAELALMDLAARATPRGSESVGYGLMISIHNFATGMGDVLGSHLLQRYGLNFHQLIYLNAGTTALVFLILPFLPRLLMNARDGDSSPAPAVPSPRLL